MYGRMNNAGERHKFQRRKQANNSRNFLHVSEDERKLAADEAIEKWSINSKEDKLSIQNEK